jgi:hypothetical protein
MTTIVTAVAAYGLLDRRQYLAASFAAIKSRKLWSAQRG